MPLTDGGPAVPKMEFQMPFKGLLRFDTDVLGIKAQDVLFEGTRSAREKSGSFKGTGEVKRVAFFWSACVSADRLQDGKCMVLYLVPKFDIFCFVLYFT